MTQYYLGTKQVLAQPGDREGEPGYVVQYPDGYVSWSPKDVFEAAYLPMGSDPTRITEEMVNAFMGEVETTRMGNHTVIMVRCRNGFSFIEDSACVDPANYDHALGMKLALEKAKKRVWSHLGFLLATARNSVKTEAAHV